MCRPERKFRNVIGKALPGLEKTDDIAQLQKELSLDRIPRKAPTGTRLKENGRQHAREGRWGGRPISQGRETRVTDRQEEEKFQSLKNEERSELTARRDKTRQPGGEVFLRPGQDGRHLLDRKQQKNHKNLTRTR